MKTPKKVKNWEQRLENLLQNWHYNFIREQGIEELKLFVAEQKEHSYWEGFKESKD